MKYQIHFIKGELSGQRIPIGKDSVCIGRSRKNDVILSDEDISRRHLIISSVGEGIKLDNLSAGKTVIDGIPLPLGGAAHIKAGTKVSIGENIDFVIESLVSDNDNDETVDTTIDPDGGEFANDADEKTAVEQTSSGPLVNEDPTHAEELKESIPPGSETIGMQTRMATPEEIQYIKDRERKQASFRWIGFAAVFLIFLLGVGFYLYFFLFQPPEKTIEWPTDDKKRALIGTYWIRKLPSPAFFALIYPKLPKGEVKIEQSADKIEIHSKVGRNSDIDIYVGVELHKDATLLKETRDISFNRWCSVKNQGKNSWNFEVPSPIAFFSRDSGIPYIKVGYSRNRNNILFSGYAYYLRYADWEIVATVEIPSKEKWRSQIILSNEFIAFDDGFLFTHWEGMSSVNEAPVRQSIDEAKLLLSHNSPSLWQRVDYLLRSALIRAVQTRNQKSKNQAQSLLVRLRLNQIEWYNMQKIAYWRLRNLHDEANSKKIETSCRAVFSSPEDMRYHKVRKNDWK